MSEQPVEIGIFGGTGFYSFLDHLKEVAVETPYGPPSARLAVGDLDGRRVAFLARHGLNHEYPAHVVNYRANLWAMRSLGVRRVLAPCSVGSLQPQIHPGEFVICDQLVDRTRGRGDTFFNGPVVNCVSFADPYCPELRQAAIDSAEAEGIDAHPTGTVVVIEGPRFSTRAESRWFSASGWDVVNMTQYPEAVLARELGMCYCGVALVTDYDAGLQGIEGIEPVTLEAVFAALRENIVRVQGLLARVVPAIPPARGCSCGAGAIDPGAFPE
ncbi:MAG TPA: S-methyl-5'-thioadenosine phosphorylase [Acidimicrobiales bacterium]|nr:S-methyl-5'-thioadenosine phosphorylase [Acidimicrobiales bacterium]